MHEATDQIRLSIVVIDDDPDGLFSLGEYLRARNHEVYLTASGPEGLAVLKEKPIDMVITDLRMPDMNGFEVLEEVRRIAPGTETIMITAFGDVKGAVQALRAGAFDFFTKPFDVKDLYAALQRTMRFQELRREKDRYQAQVAHFGSQAQSEYGIGSLIGKSSAIEMVRQQIKQVCETENTTVLIQGETGTGKEMVARAIHYEGNRKEGPFIAVDCSAIPHHLLESTFYGHVKGAFTDAREDHKGHFEIADRGTIFLDEVGEMQADMQPKLLRTLEERQIRPVGSTQEKPVDVRVVSATNQNLFQAVQQGLFREDLFYRLNTFTIHLPPLRQRKEDIVQLAEHFLNRYGQELRKNIAGFDREAIATLQNHTFRGNVRELRNLIERAAITAQSERITAADLLFDRTHEQSPNEAISPTQIDNLNLDQIEDTYITEALRRTRGNKSAAARLLGISRDALRRKLKKRNTTQA